MAGKRESEKKWRSKNCRDCPKNELEDIVWGKGLNDGYELAMLKFKKIFWKFYWKMY